MDCICNNLYISLSAYKTNKYIDGWFYKNIGDYIVNIKALYAN